jgi:hypothetical protein
MAILGFSIGAALVLCGLVSLATSVNLVPTEMGMLYALCGVILVGCGGVALSVAGLIYRIDRIVAPKPREAAPPEPEESFVAAADPAPAAAPSEDDEVNLNRSGHLPSLRAVEEALVEPEAPPQIVGRYAAGGAKYAIFSDGTIEAETDQGGYRFGSMDEFKAYLASKQG